MSFTPHSQGSVTDVEPGLVTLAWHLGGLLLTCLGAFFLAGWPAILIVIGCWAMAATMFDVLVRRR